MGSFIEDITGFNTSNDSRADQARRAQGEAAAQANQAAAEARDQARADLSPYREAGNIALSTLSGGKNAIMNNWKQDPGYEFRMQEGMKALQGSAAANGNLNSGATLKALTRYGQDYGSQEYGKVYDREYQRLSNLVSGGQASAAGQAQASQNYANAYGQNVMGAANANAAANMAQAQQMGQTAAGIAKFAFSDERLKSNIEHLTHDEIEQFKLSLTPYLFNYLSEKHGTGDWVGVMAQDLEKTRLGKTLVVENEKGEKQIDIQKAVCLLLAITSSGLRRVA